MGKVMVYFPDKREIIYKSILKENLSNHIRKALDDYILRYKLAPDEDSQILENEIKEAKEKEVKKLKKELSLKERISNDLFKWIFYMNKRDKYDKSKYLRYLDLSKGLTDTEKDIQWIDQIITQIQSEDWDNLNIDLKKREGRLLFHLLKKKGYSDEMSQKIKENKLYTKKTITEETQ